VGLLFAYAFPDRNVRSCDWQRRPAFEAYARVFGAFAHLEKKGETFSRETWARSVAARSRSDDFDVPDVERTESSTMGNAKEVMKALKVLDECLPGTSTSLSNALFTEGDLSSVRDEIDERSLVLALHGCNASTRDCIEFALAKNALWCVMPCCIVKDLYMPTCVISKLDDTSKYVFLCGSIAAKYGASLVRAVDERITNRTVLIFGGLAAPAALAERTPEGSRPAGSETNGPFHLRFPMKHRRSVGRVAARRKRASQGGGAKSDGREFPRAEEFSGRLETEG
jgi:hypothetical protein